MSAIRSSLRRHVLVLALIATHAASCSSTGSSGGAADAALTKTIPGSPFVRRMAAEWEPAAGVMVAWPLTVPYRLVVELARDTTLHVLVNDAAQTVNVRGWFQRWGIDLERVVFIVAEQSTDASWIRDYGPHPIFDEAGALWLADARYEQATPITGYGCDDPLSTPFNGGWGPGMENYDVTKDDAAPAVIAAALGLPHLPLPYALTGGNIATDGHGLALSSCVLVNENRSYGLAEEQFLGLAGEQLGLTRYSILSNFEARGIQHIDCLLKILDERRILVMRPPRDHPSFDVYERIVKNELTKLRTEHGEPFEILRLDTARFRGDELAAYSNSLILNATVYVPLFGIAQDQVALDQWRKALPGHTVKGFTFVLADEPMLSPTVAIYDTVGWTGGDALHCRTRAVWDAHMLALDVAPLVKTDDGQLLVRATISDASGRGLVPSATRVTWHVIGQSAWQHALLERTPTGAFVALLPAPPTGKKLEYYIEATSASGRKETLPRTAPKAALVHVGT